VTPCAPVPALALLVAACSRCRPTRRSTPSRPRHRPRPRPPRSCRRAPAPPARRARRPPRRPRPLRLGRRGRRSRRPSAARRTYDTSVDGSETVAGTTRTTPPVDADRSADRQHASVVVRFSKDRDDTYAVSLANGAGPPDPVRLADPGSRYERDTVLLLDPRSCCTGRTAGRRRDHRAVRRVDPRHVLRSRREHGAADRRHDVRRPSTRGLRGGRAGPTTRRARGGTPARRLPAQQRIVLSTRPEYVPWIDPSYRPVISSPTRGAAGYSRIAGRAAGRCRARSRGPGSASRTGSGDGAVRGARPRTCRRGPWRTAPRRTRAAGPLTVSVDVEGTSASVPATVSDPVDRGVVRPVARDGRREPPAATPSRRRRGRRGGRRGRRAGGAGGATARPRRAGPRPVARTATAYSTRGATTRCTRRPAARGRDGEAHGRHRTIRAWLTSG